MSAKIIIGTASWSDPEFVRDWYPAGLRPAERLPYYAQRFDMVELNSSFYGIPETRLVEQWVQATPPGFTFDVKLHQLLSRHACEVKMLPKSLQRVAQTDARNRVVLMPEIEQAAVEEFLGSLEPMVRSGKNGRAAAPAFPVVFATSPSPGGTGIAARPTFAAAGGGRAAEPKLDDR